MRTGKVSEDLFCKYYGDRWELCKRPFISLKSERTRTRLKSTSHLTQFTPKEAKIKNKSAFLNRVNKNSCKIPISHKQWVIYTQHWLPEYNNVTIVFKARQGVAAQKHLDFFLHKHSLNELALVISWSKSNRSVGFTFENVHSTRKTPTATFWRRERKSTQEVTVSQRHWRKHLPCMAKTAISGRIALCRTLCDTYSGFAIVLLTAKLPPS